MKNLRLSEYSDIDMILITKVFNVVDQDLVRKFNSHIDTKIKEKMQLFGMFGDIQDRYKNSMFN